MKTVGVGIAILIGLLVLTGNLSFGCSFGGDPEGIDSAPRGTADNLPDVAGGLSRDRPVEGQVADGIAQIRSQLPPGAVVDGSLVYAVYADNTDNDILFVGGRVADRARLLTLLRDRAKEPGGTATTVDPGPGGGQGVCTMVPRAGVPIAECAWVTATTFGQVLPLVPTTATSPAPPTVAELAALMRRMRPDLGL